MNTYCDKDNGMNPSFQSEVRVVTGGTRNYNDLNNKPMINGVELNGNKTDEQLNIIAITNEEIERLLKTFAKGGIRSG